MWSLYQRLKHFPNLLCDGASCVLFSPDTRQCMKTWPGRSWKKWKIDSSLTRMSLDYPKLTTCVLAFIPITLSGLTGLRDKVTHVPTWNQSPTSNFIFFILLSNGQHRDITFCFTRRNQLSHPWRLFWNFRRFFSYLRTDIVWPSICSPLSKPSKTCHSCGRMSIFAQKMPCDSSTKTMKTPRSRAGQDTCKILILIQTNLSWLLTSTRKAAEGKSITEQVCIKLIKIFPILLTRLYHAKTLPE